jgi:hypothetical protein
MLGDSHYGILESVFEHFYSSSASFTAAPTYDSQSTFLNPYQNLKSRYVFKQDIAHVKLKGME